MAKPLYAKGEYMLLITSTGFIVVNNRGSYSNHSHVPDYSTGVNLITLVYKKLIPKDDKYLKGAIRIVIDKKYKERLEARYKKQIKE